MEIMGLNSGFDSKKGVKKLVVPGLIVFFIVIFASLIFASFQAGNPNHSIEKTYGPLFNVSGWINISFNQEPADSLFSAFFDGVAGDSVSLEKLLDKNPAYKHSCMPLDCGKDYSAVSGTNSKTFTLNSGDSKLVGLKISSSLPIASISSFSMKINSNAVSSSVPQLSIDILDDNETDWRAYKPQEQYQEKNYGCFEEDKVEGTAKIIATDYCQKISMPVFPQVRVGANVQKISEGNVNFTISVSNNTLGLYKYCIQNASDSGEISCVIPGLKTNQQQDFFACIRTTSTADNNKYGVKYEQSNPCGFTESFEGRYTFDFEIFAQASYYDAIGNFILNNTEMLNSGSYGAIENKILNYINERYGGNCSNGCIIPIRFTSNADNQAIGVSDIGLSYIAGISTTATTIYELTEAFPKISSGYQRLFIDKAGLSVPSSIGSYDFSLKLNNQEIFSEDIEVKDVPIIRYVTPKSTAAAYPTEFTVKVTSPTTVNVSNYTWDFGDNSTITTSINKAVHIYSEIGIYNLKITVTDTKGLNSSKIFEINVTSPKDQIGIILDKMNTNLQSLKTEIQKQSLFQQTGLNSVLRIQNVTSELERLKQRYNAATNESEYIMIIENLVAMRIPENIFKTKQASSFLFFPEKSSVDMDIVQSIGGGNYSSTRIENYKNAVVAWQQENIELTMDFSEFSGEYDSNIEPLVNIFEIRVNEKTDVVHDYYLIIPELQGIGFNRNVEEKEGFVYMNLKGVSEVNFYTTEDIDFENLPAFIAPPIDKLVVSKITILSEESKKQRVIIFILSMVFLVVVGIIAYVIIYQWYKRKYENYLFKNRNDLYNIVTYVNNSKKRGLENKEITQNLKKTGWTSEQIKYVMRKYEGKRTGLIELPLIHLINKAKKSNSYKKQEKE